MKKINKLHPIILTLLLSIVLYIFQSIVQCSSFLEYKTHLLSPVIILMNILPMFLIMTFLYFVFSRVWAAFLCTSVPLAVILIINDYKIFFRDEPLKPADFGLVRETAGILENYKLEARWEVIIPTLVLAIFAFLVCRFLREKRTNITTRIIALILIPVLAVVTYSALYSENKISGRISALTEEYYEVALSEKQGYLFYFFSSFLKENYKMPEGYTDDEAEKILSEYEKPKEAEKINVIAIMSEAFADFSKAEELEFKDGFDPLVNFKRLCSEGIYGNIVVNGFGGGTSYSEFEFLTGASPYLVDDSIPEMYKTYITEKTYSLAQAFSDMGYYAEAMHLGKAWFYNRQNVYLDMGFERFVSDNIIDTDNMSKTNYYVNDTETGKVIKELYEKHTSENPDKGYFNFTVTLQNHGPYMDYITERGEVMVRPDGISDELYYTLNNYFLGLGDADAMLGDLAEYFNEKDEKVVIVFFGDHLPYIDAEDKGYEAIGFDVNVQNPEGLKNHYSVPYVIWGNDAFQDDRVYKGQQQDISANFLSLKLFDYMGIEKPRYFKFLEDVKESLNVISSHFFEKDGEFLREMPEEDKKLILNYQFLQYYNIVRFKNLS